MRLYTLLSNCLYSIAISILFYAAEQSIKHVLAPLWNRYSFLIAPLWYQMKVRRKINPLLLIIWKYRVLVGISWCESKILHPIIWVEKNWLHAKKWRFHGILECLLRWICLIVISLSQDRSIEWSWKTKAINQDGFWNIDYWLIK